MKPAAPKDQRTRDLALIHLGKQQLALDDETYRAMLHAVARVDSAARLDWAGRQRVLDHLKARGFKPLNLRQKASSAAAVKVSPLSNKILALWQDLHEAGAVRDGSERALNAWVQRQTRVSAHRWLKSQQARAVIEALKAWLNRSTGATHAVNDTQVTPAEPV